LYSLGDFFALPIKYEVSNQHIVLEYGAKIDTDIKDKELLKIKLFNLLKQGYTSTTPYVIDNNFIPDVSFFIPYSEKTSFSVKEFDFLEFSKKEENILLAGEFNKLHTIKNNNEDLISVFDITLFAELLFERLLIYSFSTKDGKKLYVNSIGNSIFKSFKQPSVQELWNSYIENNKVIPSLSFIENDKIDILSDDFWNLERRGWHNVHKDKQIVSIDKQISFKNKKYFTAIDIGTYILLKRKIRFTNFYTSNQHFYNSINNYYKNHNNITRERLPEIISKNKGLFLVQGPPGTGKTFLASQVIEKTLSINPNARILIVAKEHLGLNHLLNVSLKRLSEKKHTNVFAIRILDASKYKIYAKEISEDVLLSNQILKLKKETWNDDYANWEAQFNPNLSKYDLRLKKLLIESANLIFITSMDKEWENIFKNELFDLVIVEEASKAYPSELFHTVSMGINTLLIGDQQQLPPFQVKDTRNFIRDIENITKAENEINIEQPYISNFINQVKKAYELNKNIFEESINWVEPFKYLYSIIPNNKKFILNEEYRLEPELTNIISETFYDGALVPKKQNFQNKKYSLPEKINAKLIWIDTPHMIHYDEAGEDPERNGKRINIYELKKINRYFEIIEQSKKQKLPKESVVILTPYNEQKNIIIRDIQLNNIIKKTGEDSLEDIVKTVDEFQGHEADITIISLVRNNVLNADSAWGFISEPERLNVMFSRAKHNLVIIGCSEHIRRNKSDKNKYINKFLFHFEKYGKFINAEEI
jgi:hypothetical protein